MKLNLLMVLCALIVGSVAFPQAAPKAKGVYSQRYKRTFYFGLKAHPTELPPTQRKMMAFARADVRVPNDFYMPSKWPLPPGLPFDQGQCGSCVVNSVVGQATYQLSIRGLLPNASSPLSRGQTMECNPSAGQCDGDWATNVGAWVVSHGKLLPESTYKYTPRNGSCKGISGTEFGPFIGGHVIDGSAESIGKAMVMGVPPSVTVGAGGAWMEYVPSDYKDGIFTACANYGTNHETMLLGIHARGAARGADGFIDFAAAKPGDIVYDMLNSWGMWGDKGILHTVALDSRGNRCNNLADEAYVLDTGIPVQEPVDGGWSEWTTCKDGVQHRECNNPLPTNGGKQCVGESSQACPLPVPPTPNGSGVPWYVWVAITLVGLLAVVAIVKK